MPSLAEIETQIKDAMRAQAKDRLMALRNIKTFLKNKTIDAKRDLNEAEVNQALSTLAKQRRESIEAYNKAGREDLVAKETAELEVIQEFLPQPLSEAELTSLIQDTITKLGAQGPQDMGKVMKELKERVTGRADGKVVSQKVRELLT